jgi:2-dehydropantoate 2-reductase
MGQVPKYGIIGDGRVARHFKNYFLLEKIQFSSWSRNDPKTIVESLDGADTVLVLVSDSAIDKIINENAFLKDKRLVHFSGSHLSSHAWGAHPLMTFTNKLYTLDFYRKIPFVVEEGGEFADYFPQLVNPSFAIKKEAKSLYHALCVMSGNFTTILWNKFFESLENEFSIPRTAGLPYMEAIFQNLRAEGKSALTGPIVRGDIETIKKNLSALHGPFEKIYRAFTEIYVSGELL